VVDDITFVREILADVFQCAGFEVDTAASASEALAFGRMMRWDGLILDVDMPGMNGVELYAEMVRLNEGHRLPVIFFTGKPDEVLQASFAGVSWAHLILKPCPAAQLVAIMRQCLQATPSGCLAPS